MLSRTREMQLTTNNASELTVPSQRGVLRRGVIDLQVPWYHDAVFPSTALKEQM